MNISKARELFRLLAKEHFSQHTVVFSKQSRVAKPEIPLITITTGNPTRHLLPNEILTNEESEGFYQTKLPFTVDLFTNGSPVYDETGEEIGCEDTALDEMLLFQNFLNSDYVTRWSNKNDVSILADGNSQNLTGLINDTSYEFRSRLIVNFYFTQEAVGENANPVHI